MGAEILSSRAVIGRFYKTLYVDPGMSWVNGISSYFTSDQAKEEYGWLGNVPQLREWVGGRNPKAFNDNGITLENKHFEATVEIPVAHMRRDKSGQVNAKIDSLARRTNSHWPSLLSTLLLNGTTKVCYDGQYFFDTDHVEGNSGTQSNKIDVDISGLAVATHGTVTVPAVAEMQLAIAAGIQAIVGFKDDQGEPMNEDATSFIVMVPVALMNVGLQACATPIQVAESQTALGAIKKDFSVRCVPNPRLTWTDTFCVLRDGGDVGAFIRQEETGVQLKAKAEGSDFEFDHDRHQYGVDTWRNAGYGYWQMACLVTMT